MLVCEAEYETDYKRTTIVIEFRARNGPKQTGKGTMMNGTQEISGRDSSKKKLATRPQFHNELETQTQFRGCCCCFPMIDSQQSVNL